MEKNYRMVVGINHYQISRYKADMTAFCKLLNELFATIKEEQLFQGEVTLQMAQEIAVNNTTALCNGIDEECKAAADKLTIPFAKREIFKLAARAKKEVRLLVDERHAKMNAQRLPLQLSLQNHQRPEFLCIQDGVGSFKAAAIEENHTDTISGERARTFVERLKALVSELEQFSNDVRNMSRGAAAGIGTTTDPNSLVMVDDFGRLHVSANNLKYLDFDAPREQGSSANMVVWHGFAV